MKKVLPDTNIIIRLLRGDEKVADEMSVYDRIVVSAVVLGEFKAGIDPTSKAGKAQQKALDEFLDSSSVELVPITEETTDEYARIFRVLRAKGRPIPLNDIWIASHAMEFGAYLYTGDEHFAEIPMLKLVV